MWVRICFGISFILVLIILMLIQITSVERDFVKQLVLRTFMTICIGILIAYGLNILHIPVALKSIAAAYLFCAVAGILFIVKNQKKQKYFFSLKSVCAMCVCILFWILIVLKVFGVELKLAYENCDAGSHYGLAMEIYQSHKLNRMYFAGLYNSVWMELLEPFLKYETLYKAFIIGDATLNLFNILIFYIIVSEYSNSWFTYIGQIIVTCIYFLGWPVYSWTEGGFVYYGVGVTAFLFGMFLLSEMVNEGEKNTKLKLAFAQVIIVFCLIESYLLFVPVYLLAIFAVLIYNNRQFLTWKRIAMGGVMTLVCATGAFALIFWGYFNGDFSYIIRALQLNGGVHRELYKDFLFVLPINIYILYRKIRNKSIDILAIFQISLFSIACLALCMNIIGVLSDYYYYKLYYLIWALLFIGCSQAINYFWNNQREIIYFIVIPIMLVVIMELGNVSKMIIPCDTGSKDIFPILTKSLNWVKTGNENQEQLDNLIDVCKYVDENLSDQDDVPYVAFEQWTSVTWYSSITENSNYEFEGLVDTENLNSMVEELKEKQIQYIVVLQDIVWYWNNMDFFKQLDRVYDNSYYGVYKLQ